MKSVEIKKDINWVGSLDPNLRIFDIIMYTPYGTTYNSYVVKGSEKVAVFETVKDRTFEQYIERLKDLDIAINDIDYIIVDHTEPDHAGSVAKILDLAPKAKVVGSSCAINFLKEIANKPFEYIEVKDGDTLSLGNKTLRFINAPFLHWPDTIYTYLEEDKMLFTCDSFGSHYCSEGIFNDSIESQKDYEDALEYYYNMIMGPFKPYVLKAIDKIRKLDIEIICPGHGPVLKDNPWKIVDIYEKWSTPTPPKSNIPNITICYVSAYGYTESAAMKIVEGLKSKGDFNVNLYDVIHHDINEILDKISKSQGVIFGTPTINGDALKPIWDILVSLNPLVHGGKVASAFGSYGWSGEGVPNVMDRLRQLRMNTIEPLQFKFKPNDCDFNSAYVYGVDFAKSVKESLSKISGKKKTKKWKCIVCNEIFEGNTPPDICPACGAGSDQFIEVEEDEINFMSNAEEDIVIIGNGAAGFYAADAARKRNTQCNITIISNEDHLTYYRPSLSEALGTEIKNLDFYVQNEEWYKNSRINLKLGTDIKSIDTTNKLIYTISGENIKYQKLILANGSENFVPNICGKDKNGVYTLKRVNDLEIVKENLSSLKDVVVVGGGLLGLEAAWYMKKNNKSTNVTVVELSDHLLPRQLDENGAMILENAVRNSEINIELGARLCEILGDQNVSSVKLEDGKEIKADLILFSVGIVPNIDIADNTDIKVNRGILVDSLMKTNTEDVYACGDVAELNGIVYGNWPAAIEMGKVAGSNAVGDHIEFQDFLNSVAFKAMNIEMFVCGETKIGNGSEMIVKDINADIYKKLYFNDNIIVGGVLLGDITKSVALVNAIKCKKNIKEVLKAEILG